MRQRTVKPGFFTDRLMGRLGVLTPPLLYMGLWLLSDDQFVVPRDPEVVHGELFARWERVTVVEVDAQLAILEREGRLWPFASAGLPYYWLPYCTRHQRINRPSAARHGDVPLDLRERWHLIEEGRAAARRRRTQGALNEPSVSRMGSTPNPGGGEGPGEGKGTAEPSVSWLTPFALAWREKVGSDPQFGKLARFLRPLLAKFDTAEVEGAWAAYMTETPARYASPSRFAETYGYWKNRADTTRSIGEEADYADSGFAPPPVPPHG